MERMYVNNSFNVVKKVTLSKDVKARKILIKRVVAFSITLIIALASFAMITKIAVEAGDKKVQKQLVTYEKVEVVVRQGDTIWELQQELTPHADVREFIYLAEKYSNKSLTDIHPGDVIVLFKDK